MRTLLLLLACLVALGEPGVPIYCRRFKGNCKRIQSSCCKYLDQLGSVTTPATTTTTEEVYEEEYVDELVPGDGDPLDAQPSYVEEVFVKPTLEELNLVTAPEEPAPVPRPSQYAPRFCSILKFNCATRSSHPCCRNPLQPDTKTKRPKPVFKPPPVVKEEEPVEEDIKETITAAPVDLTRKEQRSKFSKPSKSKYSSRSKGRGLFEKKSLKAKPTSKPKLVQSTALTTVTTSKPVKKKPISSLKGKRKSSFFNRRPGGFDRSKSALCRIVNCGRTPRHKCCAQEEEQQVAEVTTTTETPETTPESSTFGSTTAAVASGQEEGIAGEIVDVVTELATLTTEVAITEEASTEDGQTDVPTEDNTEQNEEATEIVRDIDVTTSMYSMEEAVEKVTTTNSPVEANTGGVEDGAHFVGAISEMTPAGEGEERTESGEGSGVTLTPLQTMHEAEASGGQAALQGTPEDEQDKDDGDEVDKDSEVNKGKALENEKGETLESFLASYTTSPPPLVTPRVIAPVYIPPWAQAEVQEEVLEEDEVQEEVLEEAHVQEEVQEKVEAQNEVLDIGNQPQMMYTNIEEEVVPISELASNDLGVEKARDEALVVTNQLFPRELDEGWTDCRKFDCLLSPEHPCCEPHKSGKRQVQEEENGWRQGPRVTVLSLPGFNSLVAPLVLEYPGRVTATVTRVEKSYSWSPWQRV